MLSSGWGQHPQGQLQAQSWRWGPVAKLSSSVQMFRRRVNGALRRSDSQQAVKSPPLLVSGTLQPWLGGHVQSQALTCCVPELTASRRAPVPVAGLGQAQRAAGLWEGKEVLDQLSEPDALGTEGAGRRRGGCCVP